MTKVFNILLQVEVNGKNKTAIINELNLLAEQIKATVGDYRTDRKCIGSPIVDGYWKSVEAYENGEDCTDDDDWELK